MAWRPTTDLHPHHHPDQRPRMYPSTRTAALLRSVPRALFLPHDARYGCLNSRGDALGVRSDLISSVTPLWMLLRSNIHLLHTMVRESIHSDRLRFSRNRRDYEAVKCPAKPSLNESIAFHDNMWFATSSSLCSEPAPQKCDRYRNVSE